MLFRSVSQSRYIIKESDLVGTSSSTTINGVTYPTYSATATAVNTSTNSITELYGSPTSPVSGDYWLDVSTDIPTPYFRNGSSNVVTQYVKIGYGPPSKPSTYAFNGKYISPDTACVTAANTATTFTHNLGTQLYNSTLYLRCINTEAGYTAGQIIPAMTLLNNATPYSITPYIEVKNKNTTSFRSGAYTTSPYVGQSQSTGVQANLTPGNWKQFCITERNF